MGRKYICGECKKEVSDFSELIQIQGSDLVFLDKDRYNNSKFICLECDEKLAEDNKDIQDLLKNSEVSRKNADIFNKQFSSDQKGEFGETLVRFLLESTDWYVIPFGYEKSFNTLLKKIDYSKISDESLEKVRYMPDFFCIHQNTHSKNITYFVEVKYRGDSSEKFEIKELKYYKKYWPGTIIVIVRPKLPYLLFQSVDALEIKDEYTEKDFQDKGYPWIYALSTNSISYLLHKFRTEHASNTLISNQLANFKRTPEGFFYTHDYPTYYTFYDDKGKRTSKDKKK